MSVEYYQKVKELQRLQHEKEQERMELDQQLNSYLKSGKQLTQFKAARLQTYWQKICDDERKSRARNEQLLQEFQRVQTHMDALSVRTERLRMLKEQYELQVEKMYPRWKEKMELEQQKRNKVEMKSDGNEYQRLNRLRFQSTFADSPLSGQQGIPTIHLQVPQPTILQSSVNGVPYEQPSIDSYISGEPDMQSEEPAYLTSKVSPGFSRAQEFSKNAHATNVSRDDSKDDDYAYADISSDNYEMPISASNGLKQIPSRRHHDEKISVDAPATVISVDQKHPTQLVSSATIPNNNFDKIKESGLSLSSDSESAYHPLDFRKSGDPLSVVKGNSSLDSEKNGTHHRHSGPALARQQPIESDVQDYTPDEVNSPVAPESSSTLFTSDTDHESDKKSNPLMNESVQKKTDHFKQDTVFMRENSNLKIDSDSEIGSDTSLPLSDDNLKTTEQENKPKLSAEPQDPLVTTDGLWHIIKAVEVEIDESDEVDMIYNAPIGTEAIVAEIVKEANANRSLKHLNPNTMSMVILRELPLIIRKSSGGCLISDKILTSNMPCGEATIRSYMYSASLSIWDRLLQHFATLLQREAFSVDKIANTFAPLMIKAESVATYKTKAIQVLTNVLAEMPLNETFDETVSSIGVTPKYSQENRTSTRQDHRSGSQVPPLDLGINSDSEDSEDDSQGSTSDNGVPLNETDAYQQMMRQLTLQGDVSEEISGLEDDEDGTDRTLDSRARKSVEDRPRHGTPPSSTRSNKGRRNVLSSLGGMGSLGISYGNENNEDGAHIDTGRSGNSDVISSLEPTPRESAYVPSAMDQSLKSTGKSDKSVTKRSAAFWGNESDIESESEMTVPMGTGTIPMGTGTMKSDEESIDDFDFYD
ncbi:centrosomal protein kizuna-like [Anneissia japonica]|uniref:centrosomal protein kizuna-like n=1 Tax=Anneissia japonica TaxID=1529436 RepID=UPI001425A8CE|nr:centrosomal protein kizuna-like [Anneissia japonica]